MASDATNLARVLAAHPGWMSRAFLKATTGFEEGMLEAALGSLQGETKILRSEGETPYWRWADPERAETELQGLDPEDRQALHRKLFDFIAAQPDLEPLVGHLAYHAELAGLREASYLWNLRSGQILSAAGQFEEARRHYQKARDFAANADEEGRIHRELGNLDCHLGLFQDAEQPYRAALTYLEGSENPKAWVQMAQSLSAALVEQGKYAEAHHLLIRCRDRVSSDTMPLERGVIILHLTQVYIGMGMLREAMASLQEVREIFTSSSSAQLAPYEGLLEGKLEIIQGRMAAAFRIFEVAARGFETQGDIAGKLEVLLSISAPLMEHYLIREAQSLIDQVSAWEDLQGYPALEHSVHMRRLALGAFSGKWVQEDLHLLTQDSEKMGRAEDWLQFWFHMSLAARRLKEFDTSTAFMGKAREVVDRISAGLNAEQKESFLRRPDIARIWRLSTPRSAESGADQKVRARRRRLDSGPAEVATLAPPTAAPKSEKPSE